METDAFDPSGDADVLKFMRQGIAQIAAQAKAAMAAYDICKDRAIGPEVMQGMRDYVEALLSIHEGAFRARQGVTDPDASGSDRATTPTRPGVGPGQGLDLQKSRTRPGATSPSTRAVDAPTEARDIILRLAGAPGGVKNKTLAGALQVDRTTAFRYLSALKNEGLVEMRGQSRAAAWYLVSDDAR